MKTLTCELCGSTDIIKQDGVYVCQQCGAKYSPEEAKSLMVESTSEEIVDVAPPQIKTSIKDLLKLARQARDSGDRVGAETYYQSIYEKDNNNWEAIFYLAYFPLSNTSFNELEDNCEHYVGSMATALEIAKDASDNRENYIAFVNEVIERTLNVINMIVGCINESYPVLFEPIEFCTRIGSCTSILLMLAESLDMFVDNGEKTNEATDLRKRGIQFLADAAKKAKVPTSGYANIYKNYTDKIVAIEPTYENPLLRKKTSNSTSNKTSTTKKANQSPDTTKEESSKSTTITSEPAPSTTTNVSQSKSGCYIATAVYGSYDCPQVWTLRRFRDYTLSMTWYGRAFVKTYYAISPTLVRWFGKTNWFKKLWRIPLDKLVSGLQNKGVDDTPYNDRVW